jgi:exoribonuclease II
MKLLGVYADSRFASTMLDGTLDGFERLRDDLERYGNDFLAGDCRQFRSLAKMQK